jgi:WD40 repeat protein
MTKKCEVCKTDNPAEAKFCLACGSRFPEDVKTYDAFISYRRESGSHIATTIEVVLESQYKKRIFLDVRELQVGRFDEKLLTLIEQTPNFILILSRGCLDRCAEKTDWLKREVMHALEHKRNMVPVLMEDFTYPSEDKLALLPDAMRVLPNLQAIAYSHVHHESAVRKIAEALSRAGEEPPVQFLMEPPVEAATGEAATLPPEGGDWEFNPRLLHDPGLARGAFLWGSDGVITEVRLDQQVLQFTDNSNIPLAEIATVEIVKAQSSEPVRVRVTRNNGSLYEGDLRGHIYDKGKGEPCLWWGDMVSMPFRKLRRIEFGSIHSNRQKFKHLAKWGKAEISGIAFSPDGNQLAASSPGGPLLFQVPKLRSLPFADLQEIRGYPTNALLSFVSISADASLLASQEWQFPPLTASFAMRCLPNGSPFRGWEARKTADLAFAMAGRGLFSPTAPILAAVEYSSKTTVNLYSTRDGSLIHALKGHTGDISGLGFSPDGRYLASASQDGSARIWDVANGECEQMLLDSPRPLRAVAWSHDSRVFAGLTWNALMVWSCSDWTRKLELRLPFTPSTGDTRSASSLACHPSQPWIAIADHHSIVIWNWETGLYDWIWECDRDVWDIAFNRNGLLAAASQDGCLNLWRPA